MAEKNDRVGEAFENALGQLRQERLSALGEAVAMHEAMQSLLQHEVQRTERKLGAEHARTQQLKAGVQANMRLLHALRLEGELSRIDVPEIAEEGALVHGRAVDDDERGITGLTAVLIDRAGAPARDTAEPTTDASGYFAIALEPEAVDRLIKQYPDGIFLAVVSPRGGTVYRQPKPLPLARASRLFVEDVRLKRADLIAIRPPTATLTMPNLVGMTEREALATLQKAGLELKERERQEAADRAGRVLSQRPAPRTRLSPGSSVSLVIGTAATQTVTVPTLVGLTLKDAMGNIAEAGLKLGAVGGRSPTEGSVVAKQEPQPAAQVPPGTPVNLTIRRTRAPRGSGTRRRPSTGGRESGMG